MDKYGGRFGGLHTKTSFLSKSIRKTLDLQQLQGFFTSRGFMLSWLKAFHTIFCSHDGSPNYCGQCLRNLRNLLTFEANFQATWGWCQWRESNKSTNGEICKNGRWCHCRPSTHSGRGPQRFLCSDDWENPRGLVGPATRFSLAGNGTGKSKAIGQGGVVGGNWYFWRSFSWKICH